MGLFSKYSSADLNNAINYITMLRGDVDVIVSRFDPVCKGPVEFTMLLTFSLFGSAKAPKNFSYAMHMALVRSFKYWKIKGSYEAEAGFVDMNLERIYKTYNEAKNRGQNPIKAVFNAYFMDGQLQNKVFRQNPFFLIDAKKAFNNLIDKFSSYELLSYKFPDSELVYPQPKVYLNLNRAPMVDLQNNDGSYTRFYIAQIIDLDRKQYMCLMENASDTPFIVERFNRADGSFSIGFISDAMFNTLYRIYSDNVALFDMYRSPQY